MSKHKNIVLNWCFITVVMETTSRYSTSGPFIKGRGFELSMRGYIIIDVEFIWH